MSVPKVTIAFSTGNLLKNFPQIDGIAAMIGTGALVMNQNTILVINSLPDAIAQGITEDDEPAAYKEIKDFYDELGGNQEIKMLLVDEDITMAEMLDSTSISMANKLVDACDGKLGYLGVFRNPPVGYAPGPDFMDKDVEDAVIASKTFVEAQNAKNVFFQVFIAGLIGDEDSVEFYHPNEANTNFTGVVLGDTVSGKGAAIGLALGRKVKYACHIKIGKVKNGPLSASEIFIGTVALKNKANLVALHGYGFISFLTYPNKGGFYFGIDNMANDGDYSLMVHGAVIVAAAKIAASIYIDELEGEVDTNPDGTIKEIDAKHLEDRFEQQAATSLGERISDAKALVDRTVNIVNTSKTKLKIRVLPKGYNTYIDIDLGLTAGN